VSRQLWQTQNWTAIAACRKPVYIPPSPLFGHSGEGDISLSVFMAMDVSRSEAEEPYVILPVPSSRVQVNSRNVISLRSVGKYLYGIIFMLKSKFFN
jgi:hypothetical protein